MVLDQLQAGRVRVPALTAQTQIALAELLPPMTFQANPVDTGRPADSFADVLATTADDPEIDALAVYALAEPDVVDLADTIVRSGLHHRLPIVVGTGGPADVVAKTRNLAADIGVPVLDSPTALANGVRALADDARARHLNAAGTERRVGASPAVELPADEAHAKDILDALGIATPPRRACGDRQAAHRALDELRLPVAVKILDATVLHKTEIGGVHLGIGSHEQLDRALDALDAIPAPAYLLETMADAGVDMFLGARRDPVFGPIVLAGLGGTAAEAIGDVTIRSHRVTEVAAAAMLDDLQCAAMLDGWRGGPRIYRAEFARIVIALATFIDEHAEVSDIEINPLRLTAAGLIALDAVIVDVS
jgi:acetyltransferase